MNAILVVDNLPVVISPTEPTRTIRVLTKNYARLLLAGFALSPACLIAYLFFFQDPTLAFDNHAFHVVAIGAATLADLFIAGVAWRCYRSSGEPLLRWLTLSFLGFALIYAPHGAFTGFAHDKIWLFLLYGPASRLAMAILLLVALLSHGRAPEAPEQRMQPRALLWWVGLFLMLDLAVGGVATSPIAGDPAVRLIMEGGALAISALSVLVLMLRRIRSPLMVIFAISVTAFALSSVAFILARPWNHMWWLAHAIFAAGFFLLSYGVVQAYHTTQSFSTIYSQSELMVQLAQATARAENAVRELLHANTVLARMAATDPLTGADNRRRFMERAEAEVLRVARGGAPFSVLALDLDNFKEVNDRYGHHFGDDVLKWFVQQCAAVIRPYDGVARVGGEEFMIMLPHTTMETARLIAERLRDAVATNSLRIGSQRVTDITVSIGLAQSGPDGDTIEEILRIADGRLYDAKRRGRNRVMHA